MTTAGGKLYNLQFKSFEDLSAYSSNYIVAEMKSHEINCGKICQHAEPLAACGASGRKCQKGPAPDAGKQQYKRRILSSFQSGSALSTLSGSAAMRSAAAASLKLRLTDK